jgi:hypothetical protein
MEEERLPQRSDGRTFEIYHGRVVRNHAAQHEFRSFRAALHSRSNAGRPPGSNYGGLRGALAALERRKKL